MVHPRRTVILTVSSAILNLLYSLSATDDLKRIRRREDNYWAGLSRLQLITAYAALYYRPEIFTPDNFKEEPTMKKYSNRTKILAGAGGTLIVSTIISAIADKAALEEANTLEQIGDNAAVMFEDVTDAVAEEFPDEL